jgi:hypothetical protein
MNKIDYITKLKGEYNVKVVQENGFVYESGWCKNTILSGGLASLYNTNPVDLIKYLDLGKSNQLPGTAGYGLTGVLTLPDTASFYNILNNDTESYTSNLSSRIYYANFVTAPSPIQHTIREFAVKSSPLSSAFARNVFSDPITVDINSYLIFEYRLKLDRYSISNSDLRFNTNDGYTYSVPVTTASLDIPYNEVYKTKNQLLLLRNTSAFSRFGDGWPESPSYAIANRQYSLFDSFETGRGHTNTRAYTVSTVFANISSTPLGLFNEINTIAIVRDPGQKYNTEFPREIFTAMRVEFPLALYNFATDYFDISGTTFTRSVEIGEKSTANAFNLCINYTWSEAN